MDNPVKSLLPKDPEGENLGKELRERLQMQKDAADSLKPAAPASDARKPVSTTAPAMNPAGKGRYGDRPGEKRIDVKDMVKPLGSFKKGGDVPMTGVYKLHKDEHVMPKDKHEKLKKAMGLAADALSHAEPDEDDAPQMPMKKDKEMIVRKLHDKTFHIKHKHEPPHDMPEHDEEYSVPDVKALKNHMEEHFGKEEKESPGVEAAEKAIGME